MLQGLGIMQLWVWHSGNADIGSQWAPLLERVSACQTARKDVIAYLLSFFEIKRELTKEAASVLNDYFQYITPTTVWMMQQDEFWELSDQQYICLLASFTVSDRYDKKIGNMVNFSAVLKSPATLPEIFFKATIRGKVPMTWQYIFDKYWLTLTNILRVSEVMQVADHHLNDWPSQIFGNRPLDKGLTYEECYD